MIPFHLCVVLPSWLFLSGFATNILYALLSLLFSCSHLILLPWLFLRRFQGILHVLCNILERRILASSPDPKSCRTTPCRLLATAYSVYFQLPSIHVGRLLHPGGLNGAALYLHPRTDGDSAYVASRDCKQNIFSLKAYKSFCIPGPRALKNRGTTKMAVF